MAKAGYLVDGEVLAGYGNLTEKRVTQLVAIKNFCRECQGGHSLDWLMDDGTIDKGKTGMQGVNACPSTTCWLHPFRMGTSGNRRVQKGAVVRPVSLNTES